jgi:phosphocarrier protein
MITKTITINNKLGLHARAAAKFVSTASSFESEITVAKNGREVNGKSILGIMMLAAAKGSEIEISASGGDEQQAIQSLEELVLDRFGEEE